MYQRIVPLGYQQITSLTTAVNLTLPLGAKQAEATSSTLNGAILTIGGTIKGTFAAGQTITATGIPINTTIVRQVATYSWQLSNPCTAETADDVTAYAPTAVVMAIIRPTGANVVWRDDGTAPTASVGMLLTTTDSPPFEYYGDLAAIQFIQAASSAVLNVSYYALSGGS